MLSLVLTKDAGLEWKRAVQRFLIWIGVDGVVVELFLRSFTFVLVELGLNRVCLCRWKSFDILVNRVYGLTEKVQGCIKSYDRVNMHTLKSGPRDCRQK